jgi:hypothetical protein
MLKNSLLRISLSLLVASTLSVVGCAPRGESHTVDQILSDARAAYGEVSVQLAPEVDSALKSLTQSLDRLAGLQGGGDARQVSSGVVDTLTTLIPKAGFTQRAAMTELINQYRTISTTQGAPLTLGAPNLKLVVARTYSILSSELASTKFKIS